MHSPNLFTTFAPSITHKSALWTTPHSSPSSCTAEPYCTSLPGISLFGGGKELFINTLQSAEEAADMAELTRLREENEQLRAEVDALRARLARYEGAPVTDTAHVARAIARAYGALAEVSASDWIASYWVLTTYAKAPQQFAAFARWADALRVPSMPPCKADLLSKADALYRRPLYHWEGGTSKVLTRLAIARVLKKELLYE